MIVGILTAKILDRASLRDMIRMGKRLRIPVYVLPIEGIDLERQTCWGLKWNGSWEKAACPLPTVIYNRILARRVEQSPDVKRLMGDLEELGIPIFNPGYFDKGELYRIVGHHPETRHLLPETQDLQSPADLKQMLELHRQLYVKPVQSYGGKGILRIDQTENGVLINSHVKGRPNIRYASIRDLYFTLTRNRRYKKYVLQRSVSLAKVDGHVYDLRVLVQKNRRGEWSVTGVGARVAPESGIVTHVPNGGTIRNAQEALLASFNGKGIRILQDVKQSVLKLASVIEEETPGILGEMSMDIGVDESGKPWFFEANAKPGKFDEPEIRRLSMQRLLEFCVYLATHKSLVRSQK
ncbi:YheC/YheD family endospore coat-associated protein [Effusibacillus pohliae]|uniref:YheC/YheD family endospore coat-associated protein n=1 Tax=Effusibacillus pohliae TaxID=232270 RepID=UPI0003826B36|nr:YheC/YheD family protein [Effusibacillus pohliae]